MKEIQSNKNPEARLDKSEIKIIKAIQAHFDEILGEGQVEVTLDHSQKKKPFGEVLIVLAEGSPLTVDALKAHLLCAKFTISSGERYVKIEGLTPRNIARMIKGAPQSRLK